MTAAGKLSIETPDMAHITIEPPRPMLDTPLRIGLDGLPVGRPVLVRARSVDGSGRPQSSHATYLSDPGGSVDLATAAPIGGTYARADPMGLVWSMVPDRDASPEPQTGQPFSPAALTLTVEVDGTCVATATAERQRLPDDVARIPVRERGLVGTLFHPIDDGPRPGVILLGGSEGGLHEPDAALLAAHGFSVLALAYFGATGVPPFLVDIPLEYFESAIDHLLAHPAVARARVGIMGGSRGGEAALLVGSRFGSVGAVVSTVGSGILTQGIGPGRDLLEIAGTELPSWSWRGTSLPYLRNRITPTLRRQIEGGGPVELGLMFEPGMANRTEVEACAIGVERIRGVVLLVSAGDDRMWPCGPMSRVAEERLRRAGVTCEHLHFADAGHAIAPPPFGPSTELVSPGPGVTFAMGGTPAATAAARATAWSRSIEFLREHLGS